MRVRLRLFGYTVASLTLDTGPALIVEDDDGYPIVGDHEGEHIIFTPEQC